MGISSILFSQSGDRTLQPIQTDFLVGRTPDRRPVLTVMAMKNKKYTRTPQYKYATWIKDSLQTTVGAAYAAGDTTITVADSSVFIVGDEVTNGTTGDVMGVTNIPDATHIDVKRLPGATTGAISDVLRKYSRSSPEASVAPDIRMSDISPDENRVQIFRHPYGESGTQYRTDPGPGMSMEEQREVAWIQHIDDIEGAYFRGQGDYDTAAHQWRTKGLDASLQTNLYDVSGVLTLKLFRDWILDSSLSKSGSANKVILSNGMMDKAFSDWKIYADRYFPTQIGETDRLPPLNLDVAVIEIAGRRFFVINYEYMQDAIDETRFFIVDPTDVQEMVTQRTGAEDRNGDMVHRPVNRADGYDGFDWEFFAEKGFYMKEEWRHGKAYNITGINPDPTA